MKPAGTRLVVFRCDGNPQSGLGHLVRSIALAEAFVSRGYQCVFAGVAPQFLRGAIPGGEPQPVPDGMAAWDDPAFSALVEHANLLVTDHYGIDASWQRRSPVPVLAISDPPLRPQHCALLLLPTVFERPHDTAALIAPEYCLLRSQIVARRRAPKDGVRLLVNCGGGDDRGLSLRVVEAIASDPVLAALPLTVVLGQGVAKAAVVAVAGRLPQAQVVENVVDMAFMTDGHDIAVGAPGGAALERACLGLAQILIPIADNQRALADGLAVHNAALVLSTEAEIANIAAALRRLVDDRPLRKTLASAAYSLIDGRGAARVVDAVEKRILSA